MIKVVIGKNDLASQYPDVATEWDYEKNGGVTPEAVHCHSHNKYWWTCSKHHINWETSVASRSRGCGCPQCRSERISAKRSKAKPGKSLAEKFPELAAEWSQNNAVGPDDVMASSERIMLWMCPEGHEYEMRVANRTQLHQGCPYCSGHRIIKGETDFATLHPELLEEWDYEANTTLPTDVSCGSHYKASWVCKTCGHKWSAEVKTRANGCGCPNCRAVNVGIANRKPKPGGKYLTDEFPEIALEWDYSRNGDRQPSKVASRSGKRFWWICPDCGSSYSMAVCDRTRLGRGCPECARLRQVSFPEKALFFYLSKCFADAEENRRDAFDGIGRFEIDIWIPSIRTGVEYDGQTWHKNVERDLRKDKACRDAGVRLIRVREPECPSLTGLSEVVVRSDAMGDAELNEAILTVLSMLGVSADVDVARDRHNIRKLMSSNALDVDGGSEVVVPVHEDLVCVEHADEAVDTRV